MASFAEMQARASARISRTTPEITMEGTENEPRNGEDSSFDGDDADNTNNTPPREVLVNEVGCLVRRYNLPTGTTTKVEEFQQLPPSMQLIHVFLALQEIRSLVVTQPRAPANEPWRVTASFEKNVKTYVNALFAQPTIRNYDSSTIIGYMEKIIKHLRWGLPINAENDPTLWKEITSLIRDRASDIRSEWKKDIIASMASKTHITELASSLTSSVDDTFVPDGPLLVRIAVLRTVCARTQDRTYWPSVTAELKEIENADQPRQILAEYYLEDQRNHPKVGVPALSAEFTSAPSSSSIIRTAGEAVTS